ncbi:glycosyltransferase family 4 protein [Bradyrhizobium sp. NP1]|uniref:glycosyltransferase family 4 protein n=1 Tax=Bradyrhizobium sp. NP1 TaxID=3049772 RepID=UPI0025A6885E|nr:glycosyltransferase family 4 protein [Bradyrhizobium sp. NP1]WJR76364.1 glycosyltransferase family 4 protein [Bradyrhizobium sp. NP1]
MRVLYIHMTGAFAGGCRSLYEAVRALPEGEVQSLFVAPRGSVHDFFARIGEVLDTWGMSQFDNTRYSYYRGLRWLVALRELAFLPATLMVLHRAHRRWNSVDLIHVNEITGVVPWLIARRLFKAPVVVHVRSVVRNDAGSQRTRWINSLLRDKADAVIAIDETVRGSLPPELAVDVIHNSFSLAAPKDADGRFVDRLSLKPGSFKVGFVGNLLRVKGIFELIEAARLTREQGVDAEFIIVGGDAGRSGTLWSRLLNRLKLGQDVGSEVRAKIAEYGLEDRVHMAGFTADVAQAYACMDVLCFPSHYDAPGRPIFEAAFLRIPSIVAVRKPTSDTLLDGVTGLAVPPRDAGALADAIAVLAADRGRAAQMGAAAHELAVSNFLPERNSMKLLALYKRVLARAGEHEKPGETRASGAHP